jgi:3-oxoisoapionate decarboxylase
MLTRRSLLAAAAFAPFAAAAETRSQLGAAPTGFTNRMGASRKSGKPLNMLEYCNSLGLSGAETTLPNADTATVLALRTQVETYGMRVVLNTPLPKTPGDLAKFDASVKACKDCGAIAIHAAMTQRRYEQFDNFEAFKNNFQQCQKSVELAEPILAKHRIKLAIENHKGWRSAEQAAWMKRVSSEWVGVCFDFGNNIALCETPDQTLKNLAPYTVFCHIKDMAVESYKDGFLLSEVPFGEGISNLKAMVQTLRERDPNMLFCLETITRDPLKIPVFTDRYWATFEDSVSPLPARDLAKVLELVRDNPPKKPLPHTTGLSPEEQIKLEDDANHKCIEYGRQYLNL